MGRKKGIVKILDTLDVKIIEFIKRNSKINMMKIVEQFGMTHQNTKIRLDNLINFNFLICEENKKNNEKKFSITTKLSLSTQKRK